MLSAAEGPSLFAGELAVCQQEEEKTYKASAKGSKADGDVDELEDVAFQLQH